MSPVSVILVAAPSATLAASVTWLRVYGLGCGVWSLEFGVQGLGLTVSVLGSPGLGVCCAMALTVNIAAYTTRGAAALWDSGLSVEC